MKLPGREKGRIFRQIKAPVYRQNPGGLCFFRDSEGDPQGHPQAPGFRRMGVHVIHRRRFAPEPG